MKCHRGCGKEATYKNKKGLMCCDKIPSKCPTVRNKIGKSNSVSLKGHKQSEETKKKRANSLKGRVVSEETREKIKQSNIATKSKQDIVPWNKGKKGLQVAWNKGLKYTLVEKVIPSDDPIYNDIKKYRNRIATRTKKTYENFKDELNPNNLPFR